MTSTRTSGLASSIFWRRVWPLLMTWANLWGAVQGIYVSYAKDATEYEEGDLIPFVYNKLTSPRTMASMDLALLETCGSTLVEATAEYTADRRWAKATQALHGDVYRAGPLYDIRMLEDAYCQQLCVLDLDGPVQYFWQDAVRDDYRLNVEIDGMPVAYAQEDDYQITTRYWGGAPLGRLGGNVNGERTMQFDDTEGSEVYIYNHWNIEIMYKPVSGNEDRYQVIRTTIVPYSVRHQFMDAARGVDIFNPINSCLENADFIEHTDYTMIADRSPQRATGKVLFTYDVTWREYEGDDADKAAKRRWNIFLTLDGAIPLRYQMASLVFSALVNLALWGTLIAWVLRDLSYKPVYMPSHDNDRLTEEEAAEVALWPLSERVFRPPRKAPYFLAVLCGVGAHLFATAFFFIVFFRLGLINQSLGARIITPAVILTVLMSPLGGFVTGRLSQMFGATIYLSIFTSFLTATIFPLCGMITVAFCYDVFPGPLAPKYNVLLAALPIIFVWIWIMIPVTMMGGYLGHRAGPLKFFPMNINLKENESDLEITVEEDIPSDTWVGYGYRCWKVCRTPFLFIVGGVLPVLCSFAAFSYGVAGPIFLGYYSSTKLATLAPFLMFLSCAAGVAVLLQYRQIRIQQHAWWWAAFITGSSSGLHIWLLALTWLFFNVSAGDVSAGIFALHLFWFAYMGVGIACMAGGAAVAACLVFHMIVRYMVASRGEREPMLHDHDHDNTFDNDDNLDDLED